MGKAQSLPISVLVLINPLLSTPQTAKEEATPGEPGCRILF